MKITVFGASGRVGQLVTQRLLDDGHDVTVFVHRNSPFSKTEHLVVVRGDIHNLDNVTTALEGSQAIVSTLGSWGTKQKDIVSSGMKNIIMAMSINHIKRVVSLTGSDARTADDRPNAVNRMIHSLIRFSPAGKILADGEKHIQLLENSQMDWTVLRSPIMNMRGDANDYTIAQIKPKPWGTINRQSVANAMVDLIETKKYYKKAPFIRRNRS